VAEFVNNANMGERPEQAWHLTRLVADEEIGSRILGQCVALQPNMYIPTDRQEEFWTLVIELSKKLERVKHHKDRCIQMARDSVARARAAAVEKDSPPTPRVHTVVESDHTTGIEAEVEAFLMQSKAALDLLCKVLRPLAGISLHTFGKKGATVADALRNNVPDTKKARAEELARLVENDRPWLTELINSRDSVTHYAGLWSSGVRVHRVGDDATVSEPADKQGLSFTVIVETLYYNLLTFCEDFVALAINIAMPQGLTVRIVGETDRADFLTYKYGIGAIGLPPA